MTSSVLARPAGGVRPAASTSTRRPVVPAPRTPGPLVVWIDRRASVQFAATEPFRLRIVRTEPASTCDGWLWLDGYQLDTHGEAVARRKILVRDDARFTNSMM